MFDLLKKKIQGFAKKIKEKTERPKEPVPETPVKEIPEEPQPTKPQAKPIEKPQIKEQAKPQAIEEPKPQEKETPIEEPEVEEITEVPVEEPKVEEPIEEPTIEPTPVEEIKREMAPKVSLKSKLKALVKGTVELEEKDIKPLLWELELALLEADVEQTASEEICKEISQRLIGKKITRTQLEETVKKEIKEILQEMMKTETIDLLKEIKNKKDKPYKILLLGPNGAGKTTTLAKLTHLMKRNGLDVIWAASDTFRAASIEQLEKHATNLSIKVIKHQYGSDPAAVAFDAVKSAQSKGTDCVIIDSAGRQETNKNLMGELEKIVRVAQPDLKIYIGEAFTGQALLQQAKEYDKMAGIDAFILTKIDCDSKGGTTISLLYSMKKPVLFVGTGQEYEDLEAFNPEFILKRVIG